MTAEFIIPVADVDRGDVNKTWTLTTEWLSRALEGTEARPLGTPGQLTASLTRTGVDYIVRGRVHASVVLPCARTTDAAEYELHAELTLLLRRQTPPAAPKTASRSERHRTRAQKKEELETSLTDEEAAADTFSGDTIALDDFVREQLILEFPMFPLRSDLRSAASPAIGPASQIGAAPAAGSEPAEQQIDPRLAPLLEIANKLKKPSK